MVWKKCPLKCFDLLLLCQRNNLFFLSGLLTCTVEYESARFVAILRSNRLLWVHLHACICTHTEYYFRKLLRNGITRSKLPLPHPVFMDKGLGITIVRRGVSLSPLCLPCLLSPPLFFFCSSIQENLGSEFRPGFESLFCLYICEDNSSHHFLSSGKMAIILLTSPGIVRVKGDNACSAVTGYLIPWYYCCKKILLQYTQLLPGESAQMFPKGT